MKVTVPVTTITLPPTKHQLVVESQLVSSLVWWLVPAHTFHTVPSATQVTQHLSKIKVIACVSELVYPDNGILLNTHNELSSLEMTWRRVAQLVKNPPAMQETPVWFPGQEDPLEDSMTTHSGILAWRIPMDREAWWATVHGVAKSWTWLSN